MAAGSNELEGLVQEMESLRQRLMGLVASGRSMQDTEVLGLSREVDRCLNLIYRLSPSPLNPEAARAKAASASLSEDTLAPLSM